jgi:hypothetical protein
MTRDLARLAVKVVHVAWMSVALGFALELVALAVVLATAGNPTLFGVVGSVCGRVSWSVVVCSALAVAAAVPRVAVPAAGLTGFLVAPATAVAAKVIQKVITEALSGASTPFPFALVLSLALLKGVEYLWLGSALAWLGRRDGGFLASVGLGLGTGLVFGTLAVGITAAVVGPDLGAAVASFVNELLFPVGCAVILYGAERLARLLLPLAAASG